MNFWIQIAIVLGAALVSKYAFDKPSAERSKNDEENSSGSRGDSGNKSLRSGAGDRESNVTISGEPSLVERFIDSLVKRDIDNHINEVTKNELPTESENGRHDDRSRGRDGNDLQQSNTPTADDHPAGVKTESEVTQNG